jgi:hypothetical protein
MGWRVRTAQNIPNKRVIGKTPSKDESPGWYPGLCFVFPSVLSIADRGELTCQVDLVSIVWFRWFWDLTCDFWAKNAKNKFGS